MLLISWSKKSSRKFFYLPLVVDFIESLGKIQEYPVTEMYSLQCFFNERCYAVKLLYSTVLGMETKLYIYDWAFFVDDS